MRPEIFGRRAAGLAQHDGGIAETIYLLWSRRHHRSPYSGAGGISRAGDISGVHIAESATSVESYSGAGGFSGAHIAEPATSAEPM